VAPGAQTGLYHACAASMPPPLATVLLLLLVHCRLAEISQQQAAAAPEQGLGSSSVDAPFLGCRGTEVIPRRYWESAKNIAPSWMDLDLKHARVIYKVLWAITHNNMMEEHALDCGFGLAVILLIAVRAIDYDDGPLQARTAWTYFQSLRPRIEPHAEAAAALGWELDFTDTAIYPSLLGMDPMHSCYGTKLRIYVYSLPDMTRGVLHCQAGQWGLEALVPHWIQQGSCRTENPQEADFFLVPWHTWCDRMVYRLNQSKGDISNLYINLMRRKGELLPHWSQNGGKDHIFTFSDQGMNFFPEWRDYIPHSIFLVTEAMTPECGPSCFNPWKDVVLPGHTDYFRYRRMRPYNLPTDQRILLFNFHGRHPSLNVLYKNNIVRGKIMEIFHGKPDVSVGGFVDDYFERMGASHFCLVPRGTSSWTNHLYESFFAGCIPVILSDDFEVPFQDILDWPAFSIKWPEVDVSMNLHRYLSSIPMSQLRKMKAEVDAHACWFDYHQTLEEPGEECSPYLGLIRALERKRKLLHHSPGPFWRHAD